MPFSRALLLALALGGLVGPSASGSRQPNKCVRQLRLWVPPPELPPITATAKVKIDWLRENNRADLAFVLHHARTPGRLISAEIPADVVDLGLFDGPLLRPEVVEEVESLPFHCANLRWLKRHSPGSFNLIQMQYVQLRFVQPEAPIAEAEAFGLYEDGYLHPLTILALLDPALAQP